MLCDGNSCFSERSLSDHIASLLDVPSSLSCDREQQTQSALRRQSRPHLPGGGACKRLSKWAQSDGNHCGSRRIHPGSTIDQGKRRAATASRSPKAFDSNSGSLSLQTLGMLLRSVSKEGNSLKMRSALHNRRPDVSIRGNGMDLSSHQARPQLSSSSDLTLEQGQG